jgi:hypothetical protein
MVMPQKLETTLNHSRVGAGICSTANGRNRSILCTIDVVGDEIELGLIEVSISLKRKVHDEQRNTQLASLTRLTMSKF